MSELELLGTLEMALGPKLAGFAFSLAVSFAVFHWNIWIGWSYWTQSRPNTSSMVSSLPFLN